jgi:hypothetical protein
MLAEAVEVFLDRLPVLELVALEAAVLVARHLLVGKLLEQRER